MLLLNSQSVMEAWALDTKIHARQMILHPLELHFYAHPSSLISADLGWKMRSISLHQGPDIYLMPDIQGARSK